MTNIELAKAYFDAWNARDADAIVGTFIESGSYGDPATNTRLARGAIGAYAKGLWEAFPDLRFEIHSVAAAASNKVLAEWTMTGTNTGPFNGLPPTGRDVSLGGVDVIETSPNGIATVTGYFDSRTVPEQLGLQVIVQPPSVGPFAFGNSVGVQTGKRSKPGAFSITSIWNDEDEVEEVRELSIATAREMLDMDGFIGLTLMRIGGRGITISAWEKPEDAKQLFKSGAHREAMSRFWSGLGDAAFTSVWTPEHYNPLWVRCKACGKMNDSERSSGLCPCGKVLPDAPGYF
jgi:steroid delta-isomerase-like uncharacterized protein